jgi:hypothetical protein
MGAKIIVFSLVPCVAAVHGIRVAMVSLKKTRTDHSDARDGPAHVFRGYGLDEAIEVDRRAGRGGNALSSIRVWNWMRGCVDGVSLGSLDLFFLL